VRPQGSASCGAPIYVPAIAGMHCNLPVGDGQAELTWVASYRYIPRCFTSPKTVTHPGTNRTGWCRATTLIDTMH